jgi:chromosome segregation ATPase
MLPTTMEKACDELSTVPIYISIALGITAFFLGFVTLYAYLLFIPALVIAAATGIYHARKIPLLQSLQNKIKALNKVTNRLEHTNDKLKTNVKTFQKENITLQTHVATLQEIINQAKELIGNFAIERERLQGEVDRAIEQIDGQLVQAEKLVGNISTSLQADAGHIHEAVNKLTEAIQSAAQQHVLDLVDAKLQLKEVQADIKHETTTLETVRKNFETLNEKFQQREKALKTIEEKIEKRTEQLGKAADRIDESVKTKFDKSAKNASYAKKQFQSIVNR